MATQDHINELVNSIVNSYSGQFVAYHGGFPGECTSPVKYYVESVIGKTAPYMANDRADGWGTNFPGELAPFFRHEVFQAGKAYPRGTILTWNSPHIAMVLSHDGSNTVTVFEQNADPEGSPCKTASRIVNNQWHTANYAFIPIIDAPVPAPAPAHPCTYESTPQVTKLTKLQPTNWYNLNSNTTDPAQVAVVTQLNAGTPFTIGGYARHIDGHTYAMTPDDFNRAQNGDYSTNNGIEVNDLKDVPPITNPAPSVINTPTPTVPAAEKYTLVTTLVYFPTARDAKERTPKALGPVFEGTYYVVGRDAQAVKLSKDNKTDIGWINTNDNRLPIPEPVIMAPTLPVDPPKIVTEPVNVNPAPIVDIAPAKKDIPWNWLNADHSPTVYRYKGTMPVPIRDLEGTKPPLTMNAGLQGPISRFTEIQGRTYLIPDSEFKKGNAYGIPQQLMAPIHPNILQEAEGDILKFWDNFEDLPKKVYTLISDISPVKRHEVIYKGRQFIDGFKKGSKK